MNKYAARGLILDAIEGRRILVLTVTTGEALRVLDELAAQIGNLDAKVRRINGLPRIDVPGGGRISVRSWRQSLRGNLYDVAFIEPGVDAEARDLDWWAGLAVIAPELVRA